MNIFSTILGGLFAKMVGALIVVGLLFWLSSLLRHRLHDKTVGENLLTETALIHDKSNYRVFYTNVYVIHFYIPCRDTVVDCEVTHEIWKSLDLKSIGSLTHQGGKFYSFEATPSI